MFVYISINVSFQNNDTVDCSTPNLFTCLPIISVCHVRNMIVIVRSFDVNGLLILPFDWELLVGFVLLSL